MKIAKRTLGFGIQFLLILNVMAQTSKTQVVQLQSKIKNNAIELSWPQENYTGKYNVYYRDFASGAFQGGFKLLTTLNGNVNSFLDTATNNKSVREYLVSKVNGSTTEALGYLAGTKNYNPFENYFRGGMILLIDSSYINTPTLRTEISTLKSDLKLSGWKVSVLYAGRKESVTAIKTRLQNIMDNSSPRPKTLYILGHVPVPYSGYFSSTGDRVPPDGHVEGVGNHTGAWPCDAYYGNFEGSWTDYMVNCTTAGSSRNFNIPKDGKFDQTSLVSNPVELEIGRVDMYDLSNFNSNDTLLVKDYLNRIHDWRIGKTKFTKRALIDDNFTTLNLASTGYQNLPCFVGIDSVFNNRDYFTAQTNGSYLWSYGCGPGSYNSCSGIGVTSDFANQKGKFNNGFTMLAGSFFGDWDSPNNLLRGALAGGSMSSCWGGIPKWYLHHMAMGWNIGYGAKLTMNNQGEYFDGGFNQSGNGVHIALLGDPTLTMNTIKPISNLKISSKNGDVLLSWNSSSDAQYYTIYRVDTTKNTFELARLSCGTGATTTDTFFTDNCNWSTGNYIYGVCAGKLETTGSGTYNNLSLMTLSSVQHVNSIPQSNVTDFVISPNPVVFNEINCKNLKANTNYNVEILSLNGALIYSKSINSKQNGEITISLNNSYNKGVYLIRLKSPVSDKTEKFIIGN